MNEALNLVFSVLADLKLIDIELTPRDKLNDMMVKNEHLVELINKFELTL
jgi:hypothetical protein